MSEFRLPDPAEIEKLRVEWRREQRGAEIEHNNRRAELLSVRSQLHLAQQRLENEVRARRSDAVQASGRVVALERQLTETRLALRMRNKEETPQNRIRVFMSAATAAAAVVVAILGWTHGRKPAAAKIPTASNAQPQLAVSSAIAPPKKEFTQSLNRLDDALAAFPGQPAEKVLAAARSSQGNSVATPCLIQWTSGQPALVYSGGSLGNSLSATLERCAEAVEQYRPPASSK